MGQAELPDDAVAFTADDVAAARRIGELLTLEQFDEQTAIRLARAMGQTMARLAEWQVDIVTAALLDPRQPPTPEQIRSVLAIAEISMPRVEALIGHAWRRQLAAAGMRALAVAAANEDVVPSRVPMAVGFSDLVGFTELSSELNEVELAALVEGFEATAADIATEAGGRLVKTLGDEVLFVANEARAAARIALRVAGAFGSANGPRVRTGLAFGPVLPVMGDVFGPTVNLASRLTSLARPGTVLVDEEMAVALSGDDGFRLVRIPPRLARGLGLVQPYVLRAR
ncbi:MAG: adenylate/guanylate cyclase domain-containing protein [Micromonosporaceae bacterium]